MELLTITSQEWFGTIAIAIATYFFGTTGLLSKLSDWVFLSKQKREEKMEREHAAHAALDVAKDDKIDKLTVEVHSLRQEVAEAHIYLRTIIMYLKKALPDDAFIAEIDETFKQKTNKK